MDFSVLISPFSFLLALLHPLGIILTHLAVHRLHAVYALLIQMAIAVDMRMHKLLAHQYFYGEQQKGYGNYCKDDKK